MSLFTISTIVSFFLTFPIGIIFFFKVKDKNIGTILGIICLSAAFFEFCVYKVETAQSLSLSFFWLKIMHTSVILTPIFFFNFVCTLTKYRRKMLVPLSYTLGALFLFYNLISNNFFSIKVIFGNVIYPHFIFPQNFLYLIFYFIIYWVLLTYAFIILFQHYKRSNEFQRKQLKYLILGFFICWLGPHGMFLPIFNVPIYPFANFFVALYPLIFVYAIAKRQFINIDIVIKRSLVYSILVAFITGIYLIFILVVGKLFQDILGYKSFLLHMLAAFSIALIFTPLKNAIQYFIDQRFFKGTLPSLAEDKQRLEEELRRSDRLKAVATLAAGMAHEIKNPLTGIKTFTEYLDKNKDNPEFIEKFKKIVGAEVDKINNIVHQLLDFAKPAPLSLKECSINQILDETLALLSSDLLKHNIILEKEFKAENAKIMADFNQLKQAFLNILLNSIQAMPNGGTLKVGTSLYLDRIKIIIEDTGIGISEKDLPHIFDPFYTTTDEGTGLGLSITHGIIKEHNGRIDVESKVGVGSKFVVSFPHSLIN